MLPHITNSDAGRNLYDPVHGALFECYLTVPDALQATYKKDELLVSEHILKMSGLDALDRAPGTDVQKFMGTDRTFVKPVLDNTHAEISMTLSLNLRNVTDNYIYKLFRAWARLGYDISNGMRHLKKDYVASWMRIAQANRDGSIWREIVFKDVMCNGDLSGMGDVDYTDGAAKELEVKFVSDWWTETIA